MKKILIIPLIMLFLVFIPNVKAIEVISKDNNDLEVYEFCSNSVNLIPNVLIKGKKYGSSNLMVNDWTSHATYLYVIKPSTLYSLEYTFYPNQKIVSFYDSDLNFINSSSLSYTKESSPFLLNFSSPDNAFYVSFYFTYFSGSHTFTDSDYLFLHEGGSSLDFVNFSQVSCLSESDNPNLPIETDEFKIFTNFYSVLTDRLVFLSEYFITNKLFLGFISIFILVIVLELFLLLFKGGGYKK